MIELSSGFCVQKESILKSPTSTKLENTDTSKLERVQNQVSKSERQEIWGLYNKAIERSGLCRRLLQNRDKIMHSKFSMPLNKSECVNRLLMYNKTPPPCLFRSNLIIE